MQKKKFQRLVNAITNAPIKNNGMGILKDILYKIQMQNIDCKCEWLVGGCVLVWSLSKLRDLNI